MLYHVVEASSGFRYTRHNAAPTFLLAYILPNGLWVMVPGIAAWKLGVALVAAPKAAYFFFSVDQLLTDYPGTGS